MCEENYESGGVFTVGGGGANSPYVIKSPWNTECEYCVMAASAYGSNASGQVVISTANNAAGNFLSGTAPVFGSLSNGSEGNAFEGYYFPISLTQTYNPVEIWNPMGRGIALYVFVNTTAGSGYVTVAFRRRADLAIPEAPRAKAHTHSQVQSRRLVRTLPAESPQVAAAHARYLPGNPNNQGLPSTEDLAAVGNVEEMTPAQRVLSKLRGGR